MTQRTGRHGLCPQFMVGKTWYNGHPLFSQSISIYPSPGHIVWIFLWEITLPLSLPKAASILLAPIPLQVFDGPRLCLSRSGRCLSPASWLVQGWAHDPIRVSETQWDFYWACCFPHLRWTQEEVRLKLQSIASLYQNRDNREARAEFRYNQTYYDRVIRMIGDEYLRDTLRKMYKEMDSMPV